MKAEGLISFQGLPLDGPLLLKPNVFGDERGFFFESWNETILNDLLVSNAQNPESFVQDNHSRSVRGVLRGLHFQIPPHAQAKLVRCVAGEIFDVVVDLRLTSPTFCQSVGVNLNAENHHQLWVPRGFAHGFLTLSNNAEVLYKTTDFWNRNSERSIRWDDPHLAIAWKDLGFLPSLSEKDAVAPLLKNLSERELFQ